MMVACSRAHGIPVWSPSHLSIPSVDRLRDVPRHTEGKWSGSFAVGSLGGTAFVLVGFQSTAKNELHRRRKHRAHALFRRASKSSDDEVEQASAALEASRLQVQAAKLKAELEELEKVNRETHRVVLAERLLAGNAVLTATDLKSHMKKEEGVTLADEEVEALMLAIKQNLGRERGGEALTLAFDEIASEAFEAEVKRLKVQQRDAEVNKFLEKREEEKKELESKRQKEETAQEATAGPGPDDTSTATKVLSVLAYMLPLADAVQLLVPLMQEQPVLALPVAPFIIANLFVSSIPLGNFLLIIIFGIAARNASLPTLLRFNLEQAVLVCIVYQAPVLLYAMAVYFDPTVAPALGAACFAFLLALVGYCVARISSGRLPDELPLVSNAAKNFMDRGGLW